MKPLRADAVAFRGKVRLRLGAYGAFAELPADEARRVAHELIDAADQVDAKTKVTAWQRS